MTERERGDFHQQRGIKMDELTSRAYRAYFRSAKRAGLGAMQPSDHMSGVEVVNGRQYTVLRNTYQVLAVYGVRNDGRLKRLERWPAELSDD